MASEDIDLDGSDSFDANGLVSPKRAGIKEAAALNTKTDKFFGLNKMENSVRPQKSGWLSKKPYYSSGFGTMWWKKFFVVKDSFLFCYSDDAISKTGEWDTKPALCIPLGNCTISLNPNDPSSFRVICSEIKELSLNLKSSDIADAHDWVNVLNLARRSTWENAILGSALLEKMHAKGTELETETERIMKNAQKEAERLRAEQDEQDRLVNQKMEQENQYASALAAAQSMANTLKSTKSQAEMKLVEHQNNIETEKQKRLETEQKLVKVQNALVELEKLFATKSKDKQGQQYKDNDTVISSVQKLRNYFEQKIQENKEQASYPKKKSTTS